MRSFLFLAGALGAIQVRLPSFHLCCSVGHGMVIWIGVDSVWLKYERGKSVARVESPNEIMKISFYSHFEHAHGVQT